MAKTKRMVKLIHNNGQPVRFNKVPGRNESCPCGSGLKFKKCHISNWNEFLKEQMELMSKSK